MKKNPELHETNRYKDSAFPVGVYIVTPLGIEPEGRGYQDLHWHEELQYTLVTDGECNVQVNGVDYRLKEGEMIFINRNLLHITTKLSAHGRYMSLNFPDKMLSFFAGSRMEQDYVTPFTGNVAFPALVYSADVPWQAEGLSCIREIFDLLVAEEKPPFLEYRVSLKCAELWIGMISNCRESIGSPSNGDVRKQHRIRDMLTYIHANYMNPITLAEVAEAAHVSEGECCRCFRSMVRRSPMQYLQWYRISKGQEMLNSSQLSVTEIAYACGFGDSSHFIQYFRKQNGITPKEYRKQAEETEKIRDIERD